MEAERHASSAALKGVLALAAALFLAGLPRPADAFDGDRRGFVLGFGAGPGLCAGQWGLETDLKIGKGLTDRTVLHYSGKQIWVVTDGGFFTAGYPSIALTVFDHPRSPSGYFTVGGGLGILGAAFGDFGGVAALGPSAFIGFGYEFTPHGAVELHLGGSLPGEGVLLTNASLTLNVLGY